MAGASLGFLESACLYIASASFAIPHSSYTAPALNRPSASRVFSFSPAFTMSFPKLWQSPGLTTTGPGGLSFFRSCAAFHFSTTSSSGPFSFFAQTTPAERNRLEATVNLKTTLAIRTPSTCDAAPLPMTLCLRFMRMVVTYLAPGKAAPHPVLDPHTQVQPEFPKRADTRTV